MLNPFLDVNWNPGRAERRKFALSLMIGFPVIAAVLSIVTWMSSHTWRPFFAWLGGIGLAAGLILWLFPKLGRFPYRAWYMVACLIGLVVGNVLLIVFFYCLFTPIGLLSRLSRRNSIRKGFDKERRSYWQDAEEVTDLKRYYRQF